MIYVVNRRAPGVFDPDFSAPTKLSGTFSEIPTFVLEETDAELPQNGMGRCVQTRVNGPGSDPK